MVMRQLISCALDALVHGDGLCGVDGLKTLIHRVAALHVVHEMNVAKVLWFGQLVTLSPGIMVHLKREDVCDKIEMVGHKIIVWLEYLSTSLF